MMRQIRGSTQDPIMLKVERVEDAYLREGVPVYQIRL